MRTPRHADGFPTLDDFLGEVRRARSLSGAADRSKGIVPFPSLRDRCGAVGKFKGGAITGYVHDPRTVASIDATRELNDVGPVAYITKTLQAILNGWRFSRRLGRSRPKPAFTEHNRRSASLRALSVRTESFERREMAPNQNVGASSYRKSLSTFRGLLQISRFVATLAPERQGPPKRRAAIDVQKLVHAVPCQGGGQEGANRHPTGQAAAARHGVKQARRAPWNEVLQQFEEAAGGGEANLGAKTLAPANVAQRDEKPGPPVSDKMLCAPGQARVRSLGARDQRENGDRRDAGEGGGARE